MLLLKIKSEDHKTNFRLIVLLKKNTFLISFLMLASMHNNKVKYPIELKC